MASLEKKKKKKKKKKPSTKRADVRAVQYCCQKVWASTAANGQIEETGADIQMLSEATSSHMKS